MAYIKAFMALILLVKEIIDWIRDATQEDPAEFIGRVHAVIVDAKQAQTPEAKQNAAKNVQDLIRRL